MWESSILACDRGTLYEPSPDASGYSIGNSQSCCTSVVRTHIRNVSQHNLVLSSQDMSPLAFERMASFPHAAIIGCRRALCRLAPTDAIIAGSAMAEMVSAPVMMLVQRPKRGTSPLRMFSSTVSAMSSALWPAACGTFDAQIHSPVRPGTVLIARCACSETMLSAMVIILAITHSHI